MYYKTSLLILVLNTFFLLFALGGFFGAIWAPTRKKDYERIDKLMDLKPGTVLYDLGSGSAGLLFYLSKKYNIKCVGIEVSPILYLYSKIKSLFYKNVEIKFGSFLWHDLKSADIIYVFLLPRIYNKLRNKIKNNTKENVKIISAVWPFENIKYSKISEDNKNMNYYFYYKRDLL